MRVDCRHLVSESLLKIALDCPFIAYGEVVILLSEKQGQASFPSGGSHALGSGSRNFNGLRGAQVREIGYFMIAFNHRTLWSIIALDWKHHHLVKCHICEACLHTSFFLVVLALFSTRVDIYLWEKPRNPERKFSKPKTSRWTHPVTA